MAEPLGIASSIITVLQLSRTVVNLLTTACKASEDQKRILTEVIFATGILYSLKELAEGPESGGNWASKTQSLNTPQGPIAQFRGTLEDLYSRLKPAVGVKKLEKSLKWPFQKDDIKDILNKLERLKSSFLMALEFDHIRLSKALENGIADAKDELGRISGTVGELDNSFKRKEFLQVLDWLSPLTFDAKQNSNFELRQNGTGEWFLQSQEFQSWLRGLSKYLWCPGPPGAGKSVMASVVIDYLEKLYINTNTSLAYIYFSYEDIENQSAATMLASILRQLIQRRGSAPEQLMALYNDHSRRNTKPKVTDISTMLVSECLSNQKTFIVIDALDECSENENKELFLDELHKLPPTTHLMLTSRPDAIVMYKISDKIQLDILANNADVAAYVEKRLEEDTRLKRHITGDAELKAAITAGIVQNARGQFLLPRLHLDYLGSYRKKRDLKLALRDLTHYLKLLYAKAIKRILGQKEDDVITAKQVLSWIFHAARPLNVEEIQHALAVEAEQRDFDEDCLICTEDILTICAGLVTFDRDGRIIHFVHQTVHEYLETTQSDLFPTAQESITRTCLIYLRFEAFANQAEMNEENLCSLSSSYPLLLYAAQYWGYHASHSPEDSMVALDIDFLEHAPSLAHFAMHTLTYQYGASGRRTVPDAPKLQIAASFGLKDVVKYLLEGGADVEARSSDGWTALSSAAWTGRETVVELLLEHGADIEAKNNDGWNALLNACRNEHIGVICTLLEKGADIETQTNTGWTPLLGAVWHGHESVVRLLLERGANIEASNSRGWTSLHQAAGHGDSPLIQLLLDSGADVHARSTWGWTPLMSVVIAKTGGENSVQLLLQAGSNKAAIDTRGETAYEKAVQHGKTTLMSLLE